MSQMEKDLFNIKISPDQLTATIDCTKNYEEHKNLINKYYLQKILDKNNIVFGIDEEAIQTLLSTPEANSFPIIIAKGKPPQRGEDGKIIYKINVNSGIDKTKDWNFRDVMKIPSVRKGDQIAEIIPPTQGVEGIGVNNYRIEARAGKPYLIRPGKNVEYNENDHNFYATMEGQVVIKNNRISVEPVYEVHGDLSLEVGNIKFVGNVNIFGDVPTGFSVEAGGDIKIYGLVEAATIKAGGSIFINEGFAGLQKGVLKAGKDIHLAYINQGKALAKESVYVENSILHSQVVAGKDVFCKRGNIIGGSITLARTLEAQDIGNRLNIRTNIYLQIDEKRLEKEENLLHKKKDLKKTLKNLSLIKEKLLLQERKSDQIKQLIVRQENSYNKVKLDLKEVEDQLREMDDDNLVRAKVYVRDSLYPNTTISFGKYQRLIQKTFQRVQVSFDQKEINIQPYNI